jgi:hypothetical protein
MWGSKTMTKRSPSPTPPTKPKDRSMLAIVLAVMLHIVVAVIIYFAVFDDKSSKPTTSTPALEPSALPSVVKTVEKPPLSLTEEEATSQTVPESNQVSSNNAKTAAVANSNVATKKTAPIKSTPSLTEDNAPRNNSNARTEPAFTDDNQTRLKSTIDNQDSTPEYTLKKTKEYETLDTEIDKDSEQLAKLIDEVKKRNQQQIEQQRTNTLGSQSIPNSVPKPAAVTSEQRPQSKTDTTSPPSNGDYPITPIKPLNNE